MQGDANAFLIQTTTSVCWLCRCRGDPNKGTMESSMSSNSSYLSELLPTFSELPGFYNKETMP